jgi:hypothetical protein
MATVRFSKELIDRIEKQARAKMEPAVNRVKEQKLDANWGQRIYDTMFLEAKPTISQVPAGWLKTMKHIEIGRVGNAVCNMTFDFATPQPWPYVFPDTGLACKNSTYGDSINLRDNIVWGEFHAEVTAYHQRVQEAAKRRDEFVAMVKKICDAYSTLAPALKAWPPLWDLIPDDVKDKHREIKERTKNEVVLDVDIGKLTAMSTAAKFGI